MMPTMTPAMMDAFPPAADRQVHLGNWRLPPFNRWSFQHVREIVPTAEIAEDPARRWDLPRALGDLGELTFAAGGRERTLAAWLAESQCDGLAVLKHGTLLLERYDNHLTETRPHIVFSVSKSITALLCGVLAERGQLDPDQPTTRYIPEAAGSAYGDATVRQVLDMQISLDFDEVYLDPDGLFARYRDAMAWNPVRDPARLPDLRGFLLSLGRREGPHGKHFRYLSPNSDFLGWLCERAAGEPYAALLSRHLWQPLGAERAGYVTVDRLGAARSAGGICVTLRDLARLGEMVRCRGLAAGRQVVPGWWIDDILTGGDPAAWDGSEFEAMLPPDGRYRSQWYLTDGRGSQCMAVGIHGQWIWIDRERGVTIAKLSSQPLPTTDGYDAIEQACFAALAAAV